MYMLWLQHASKLYDGLSTTPQGHKASKGGVLMNRHAMRKQVITYFKLTPRRLPTYVGGFVLY